MTLLEHHQDLLAMIDDDIVDEAGVFSAINPDDLPEEFRHWDKVTTPALVFPWIGAGGTTVLQVRPDQPVSPEDKYLTPPGSIMPLGVHPRMRERVADAGVALLLCEGTKQHLAAVSALRGLPWAVVGITGCWGWSKNGLPVPDFEHVPWADRSVVLLFDADADTNRDVWEAARALSGVLEVAGAKEILHARVPARGTAGLDDYLRTVTDRTGHLERILARATPKLGRAPARKSRRTNPYVDAQLGGLQVADLARDLRHQHPMAAARDQTVAVYQGGVYRTGSHILGSAVAGALGNDYRRVHFKDVEDYLSKQLAGEGLELPERAEEPVLNLPNGMLHLLTGELRPHDPAYLSTVQLPVPYDPDATCPRYEAWVAEYVGAGQLDDVEEVISTMLDPSRTPSKAVFFFGPSRSGKSTMLRLMMAVVGRGNVSAVTLHQLSDDRYASAGIYGKILNAAADLSAAHVNDLSLFKMLTGEDLIHANRKYGHQFDFTNRALFAFSANTIPTVGEASRAYLERIKPIEFATSFAGFEDPDVEAGMMEELPGILARWVRAYRRLRERGRYLATDPVVQRLFEESSDRIRRWVSGEMTVLVAEPGAVVAEPDALTQTELLRLFNGAAERDGEARIGLKKFGEHLRSVPGVTEVRRLPTKVRAWNVVRQREDGEDPDDGGESGKNPLGKPRRLREQGGVTSHTALGLPKEILPLLPPTTALPFDLETAGSERLWSSGPGFVRIAGYRPVGADEVVITTDPDVLVARARDGATLVGHNVWGFDLLALARHHHLDLTTVCGLDTKLLAFVADPPPARMKDGEIERRYGLDALGGRLFGLGKEGSLKALARRHGGYDRIPLDDPEYRAYLARDVEITAALAEHYPVTPYAVREHELARIAAVISTSGFRVDRALLERRLAAGAAVRAEMLDRLAAYGLPTTRKDGSTCVSPHATEEGKAAIVAAFEDLGVTLPRTPKGNPSLGQEAMERVAERHPEAAALAETVKSLNGVRTIYETTAAHLVDDRVHPAISLRQATGRWSTTKPGLTVMGKRAGKHVEREIFLPEEGEVILAADLAQVDARAIAALSGDEAYLALFEPGRDAHAEIAQRVWGDPKRREDAKAIGHGWNYGMGIPGLVARAGVSEDVALQFDQAMREAFPRLVEWRNEVRERARAGELLDNGFGRMMRPNPDRAHTQGPALLGQGCARDILMKGLLELPPELWPRLRVVVHDEVVLSVPAADVDEVGRLVVDALSFDWAPPGALRPVRIMAGLSRPGSNWGAVYAKEGAS